MNLTPLVIRVVGRLRGIGGRRGDLQRAPNGRINGGGGLAERGVVTVPSAGQWIYWVAVRSNVRFS